MPLFNVISNFVGSYVYSCTLFRVLPNFIVVYKSLSIFLSLVVCRALYYTLITEDQSRRLLILKRGIGIYEKKIIVIIKK